MRFTSGTWLILATYYHCHFDCPDHILVIDQQILIVREMSQIYVIPLVNIQATDQQIWIAKI